LLHSVIVGGPRQQILQGNGGFFDTDHKHESFVF
jgi:hypothetical protein